MKSVCGAQDVKVCLWRDCQNPGHLTQKSFEHDVAFHQISVSKILWHFTTFYIKNIYSDVWFFRAFAFLANLVAALPRKEGSFRLYRSVDSSLHGLLPNSKFNNILAVFFHNSFSDKNSNFHSHAILFLSIMIYFYCNCFWWISIYVIVWWVAFINTMQSRHCVSNSSHFQAFRHCCLLSQVLGYYYCYRVNKWAESEQILYVVNLEDN